MIFIGIDIGLNGGLAFIEPGKNINAIIMPTIANPKKKTGKLYDIPALSQILKFWGTNPCYATIEHIQLMPGKGGATSFLSLGTGWGIVQALLTAHNIPYQVVLSRAWQKILFTSINKCNTKEASVVVAKRLFPRVSLVPDGCRKPHDGISDALLLAEYGRKTYVT